MRIEAFSRGKHHARPEENEDSLLVLPGIGYAVFDGVTDRTARRYGGERAGRYASRAVAHRLAEALPGIARADLDGRERALRVVAEAAGAIRDAYRTHAMLAEAEAHPPTRMSCTLAVAVQAAGRDGGLTLVVVGDSGIRITRTDGAVDIYVEDKALDTVTALMRREAWHWARGGGADPERVRALSDSVCWNGFAAAHEGLAPAEARRLRDRVEAVCREALPRVPAIEVDRVFETGILGQRAFANHPAFDLGYGVLDGFDIPARYLQVADYRAGEVARLEIHSDGYFATPPDFGIDAWEAAFRAVERDDPDKIGAYPSTKGSTATSWTDDRTYLGVDFAVGTAV